MNDRFLFRAKRIDNSKWVEGNLIFNEKDQNQVYIGYLFGVVDGIIHDTDIVEVYPQTVCQRTGSKDMSGNRIYENDIVTYGKHKGIVKFGIYDSKHLGFHIEWMKGYGYRYLRKDFPYWVPEIKVVGNIFDNPELLEVE